MTTALYEKIPIDTIGALKQLFSYWKFFYICKAIQQIDHLQSVSLLCKEQEFRINIFF